ncbi:MAG: hypothetical protein RIG77_11025 [Cyclobacteriaceae bacterium]
MKNQTLIIIVEWDANMPSGIRKAQLNRHEESVRDYITSSKLDHRRYDCYFNLGLIYGFVIVKDSLAIVYLEMALEEKPESQEAKDILDDILRRNISI